MSAPDQPARTCYIHPQREANIQCQRCGRYICSKDMIEAAVGFQCPNCVNQGKKTVRQPRTVAGGVLSADTNRTTLVLIAINVVVYLLTKIPGPIGHAVYQQGAMADAPVALDGQYWRLLTSEFLHVGILHLGFNMLALFIFGPLVESMLGRWRFIVSYLTIAVASSLTVYWLASPLVVTVGASGAIFGLFAICLILMIRTRQNITGMIVLVAINAAYSLQAQVSWQAHLGGFLTGLLLGVVFAYGPKDARSHILVFVLMWVLMACALVVRTGILLG